METLFAIIEEITLCVLSFSDDMPAIQYNLFEHSQPENLAVNGFYSLSEYGKHLACLYGRFRKLFDKLSESGKDTGSILFLLDERINRYSECLVRGQKTCFLDSIFLANNEKNKKQIEDIRLKVSGFLSFQKKNIGGNKKLCSV